MVLSLEKATTIQPREFYGSSLPRPRIYTNPQFNTERVDPPLPVMAPLLSWATEAHWSMGGLSFKRLRFQGRIEGNINKLRAQRENALEKTSPNKGDLVSDVSKFEVNKDKKRVRSISPPPAPVAIKRRRFLDLNDENDESEDEEVGNTGGFKRGTVRRLGDDFDRVAKEIESEKVGVRARRSDGNSIGNDVMKIVEEVNELGSKSQKAMGNKGNGRTGIRTSPRLAKRRLC